MRPCALKSIKMASENALKTNLGKNERNEVLLHEGDGFQSTEELTKCKSAVCMIRFETRCLNTGKRLLKRGSGFYARAKIFGVEYCCIVTNNHVIGCEEDAVAAKAIFNFEKENQGVAVRLRPETFFCTNAQLDYTVIGVNEEELYRLRPRVFPIEYITQPQATVGDDIFIFQHPLGLPKKFSYEKITSIEHPFVYYKVDTDNGSSGSPVLWKLRLLAIHVTGSKEDGYNKGTLFSEIVNDLHAGCNLNGVLNRKRDFSCVNRNIPTEMEENLSKRMCVDDVDEKCYQPLEGANTMGEQQHQSPNDERLQQSPDDITLDKLSQDISGFYKKLGRQLGVRHEKIEEISNENIKYGDITEKCFQVLKEWKDSNPSSSTNEVLENALRDMGKNALANKYFSNQ